MQPRTTFAGRSIPLENYSPFRRLAIVHAAMMGADAAMVVALADSAFFSVDPDSARSKVLLFLVISFAPFLLVAPLIGPMLDRIAGGRRAIIQVVAAARIALSAVMASVVATVALFPLVFVALVLQKTYVISKSAIVPSVVRSERDLVEANSKLGLIAGLMGFVAVIPAGILQKTVGGGATLIYAALVFGVALVASTWLQADVVAATPAGDDEQIQLHSSAVQVGALVMTLLRAVVGFVFFLIAMVLKAQDAGLATYGAAVSAGAIGSFIGNYVAVRVRAKLSERWMLLGSTAMLSAAGLAAAITGGNSGLILLSFAASLAAAIGRMGFESIVQREAPAANRGRAFANFETRFQFGWALAGMLPVVITMSGAIGALIVGVACAACIGYTVGLPKFAPGVSVSAISSKAVTRIRTRNPSERKRARLRLPKRRRVKKRRTAAAGDAQPGTAIELHAPPSSPAPSEQG